MCRNIKRLYNFDPPANEEEINAAATQFVRKVTGFSRPAQVNQAVIDKAVADISLVTIQLLRKLVTTSSPRNREVEAEKSKVRSAQRLPG